MPASSARCARGEFAPHVRHFLCTISSQDLRDMNVHGAGSRRNDMATIMQTKKTMARPDQPTGGDAVALSRQQLADFLNEDLAREDQAGIAYAVYSQFLQGAQCIAISQD